MYFSLQWHITPKCDQRCKFCYMYDSPTYASEVKNQQDYKGLKKILDNYLNACKRLGAKPNIAFTGGDPLLHPDFFKLLSDCKKRKVEWSILGNPYHLTDSVAKKLKKFGIESYQMSIDGLEKTHDYFRKKGSFKATINKYKLLKKNKISAICMFTLSNKNMKELIPVMEFLNNKVDGFSFARMVPTGCGSNLSEEVIKPNLYKKFLDDVEKKYEELKAKKSKTRFGYKDHLWKLYFYEKGQRDFIQDNDLICDGCKAGNSHITILADGSILLCRRMAIILGNALSDDLYKVFVKNKTINEFRKVEKRKKCKDCELLNYCRGCPAIGYALTGDIFAEDPTCWKKI